MRPFLRGAGCLFGWSCDLHVGPRINRFNGWDVTTSLSTPVVVECPYTKMATAANCGGLNPTVSGGPKVVAGSPHSLFEFRQGTTLSKIEMDPKKGGLGEDNSFQIGDVWCPAVLFSGVYSFTSWWL